MADPKGTRLKLGLNQQEMADLMGVHRQTWVKWERDERRPDRAAQRLLTILTWLHDNKLLEKLTNHIYE